MARFVGASSVATIAIMVAGGANCLPVDERPEPGSLLLNVKRSDAATDGFVTDDGWHVAFDRFVTALGGVAMTASYDDSFASGDCVDYSYSTYDRLYDFAVANTSKVVLHYGLGQCIVPFTMGGPSQDAILMAGVAEWDRDFMTPEDVGRFRKGDQPGIGLMLEGRAEREGVTKRFTWLIRNNHFISECHGAESDDLVNAIELHGGDVHVRQLVIRPQELFRLTPSLDAAIEFGRIASADTDDDGVVTLSELGKVELPYEDFQGEPPDDWGKGKDPTWLEDPTLEILIQDILSARVAAFEGAGECVVDSHGRRGPMMAD